MSRNLLQSLDYSVLQQCMHCGMCLPACPTYAETGFERHSPRGRISLMRAIADGELEMSRTFGEEMYYCLGCLACTSACPAGVDYAELFETARAEVERTGVLRNPQRNFWRWLSLRLLFTRPRLLRAVGRLLWLYQTSRLDRLVRALRLSSLLPRRLRELEPTTPRIRARFSDALIAPVERPRNGPDRHRVALLTGCVQDLAFSEINRATVDVLLANGCEVHTPRSQSCCGSLHAHNGDAATARLLARRQLDAIDPFAFDAIISNAGGCGSHLRHYDRLLADDPAYAPRAVAWSGKLRDISEWLVEIGFRAPKPGPSHTPQRITYHESCHLRHGQHVSAQPEAVLTSIPGLEFHRCTESSWCCGSAGIYNITQPKTARWLQERKIGHVLATGAATVATANPGCHLQLQNGLHDAGATQTTVEHPVVLLARAYQAESDSAGVGNP
ncbi:lactate utilization protein A [mine drainage metagenome]|uniref:Lactate utilization protein A n=1 Tax=mine drainage metagenome TaxID=410659 RepID=A0A1J5S644_9ZZZZ